MREFVVVTAIGKDRPGLVAAMSGFILRCGCNIEDSSMAMLGGDFAMLILVDGPPEAIQKVLDGANAAAESSGLSVQVRRTRGPGEATHPEAVPYKLVAYSLDHPGIVQRLSHFLAERDINIRSLDTKLSYAPHSGQPLFSLHALVDVPTKVNLGELRRGLEGIEAQENIDIELHPAT